jgi:hypothetical protein
MYMYYPNVPQLLFHNSRRVTLFYKMRFFYFTLEKTLKIRSVIQTLL